MQVFIDVWNMSTFDPDLLSFLEPNARLVHTYFEIENEMFLAYDLGRNRSGYQIGRKTLTRLASTV